MALFAKACLLFLALVNFSTVSATKLSARELLSAGKSALEVLEGHVHKASKSSKKDKKDPMVAGPEGMQSEEVYNAPGGSVAEEKEEESSEEDSKEEPAPAAPSPVAAPPAAPVAPATFTKIAPFGREDTAKELQDHASRTQDTLVDAVENAEVAEIKRSVFRALTRLRAASIKEFDTIARLETQSIDSYNDAHHYRSENPLAHLHEEEAPVETDKLKSFH
eukprot:TRINITY_DN278_c0_g3_i1.p1 TRINITY_DN278_c0_g3~~TRINITY_DN278_c0_g3_i1.p1  ORF type:complete len:252 (+),score=69.51 TRINITY_DN278_c0_g3_i1:96-758(+)